MAAKVHMIDRRRKMPARRVFGIHISVPGARRRRSGAGSGGACAQRPVGTYLYLHAVGASNHVAVQGMAR
jgi:hypothetical protein